IAGILEPAPGDRDLRTAPLGLDAVGGVLALKNERAVADPAVMTADHVDARTAVSPPFQTTAFDRELIYAGELDRVAVPPRPHVLDIHAAQDDVLSGIGGAAAVVDIEPVARRAAEA